MNVLARFGLTVARGSHGIHLHLRVGVWSFFSVESLDFCLTLVLSESYMIRIEVVRVK